MKDQKVRLFKYLQAPPMRLYQGRSSALSALIAAVIDCCAGTHAEAPNATALLPFSPCATYQIL